MHAIAAFVASSLEGRLRNAEADLRQIESDEMRERWGAVSQLSGYESLPPDSVTRLTPAEIKALPAMQISPAEAACESVECSIFLEELAPGDIARKFEVCGHTFHCSCIDLWLLRCAHCPLCKRDVRMVNGCPEPVK